MLVTGTQSWIVSAEEDNSKRPGVNEVGTLASETRTTTAAAASPPPAATNGGLASVVVHHAAASAATPVGHPAASELSTPATKSRNFDEPRITRSICDQAGISQHLKRTSPLLINDKAGSNQGIGRRGPIRGEPTGIQDKEAETWLTFWRLDVADEL
jgi:hypothetical protein